MPQLVVWSTNTALLLAVFCNIPNLKTLCWQESSTDPSTMEFFSLVKDNQIPRE
jgi:hypothetical protein